MIAKCDEGKTVSRVRSVSRIGCVTCLMFANNLCEGNAKRGASAADLIPQTGHTVPARRFVDHGHDFHDAVPVVCSGWAASVVTLPDGRQQILSFLLPGDIVSLGLLSEPNPRRVIKTITQVRYRTFKRRELKDLLFNRPDLLDSVLKAWVEEETRVDGLIVDLGRRSGDERIARLILNLVERLTTRDMVQAAPLEFEFPLRQHQIAEATGLTQVHVCKVLSDFRHNSLIRMRRRMLTILDLAGLHRKASIRSAPVSAT
jgi:CRP/FNR family transcriptional regulator